MINYREQINELETEWKDKSRQLNFIERQLDRITNDPAGSVEQQKEFETEHDATIEDMAIIRQQIAGLERDRDCADQLAEQVELREGREW